MTLMTSTPAFHPFFTLQLRVMMKKNLTVMIRNKRATIVQLLVPFVLTLLLFAIKFGLEANQRNGILLKNDVNPSIQTIPRIFECVSEKVPNCITYAFSPSTDPNVVSIVDRIKSNNGFTKSRGFETDLAFNQFSMTAENSTQAAVHFNVLYKSGLPTTFANIESISYTIQNNLTQTRWHNQPIHPMYQVTLPYIKATDRAILELTNEAQGTPYPGLTYDFDYAQMPHPKIKPQDVIGDFGPTFFFGALMFNIVMQLGGLVTERELHLRQSMHQMGLSVSAYWMSYFIVNFALNTLCGLLLIVSGLIFQFDFFLKTEFPVYFILFWLFGLSMVTFVFFVSNFVSKARTATILGFAMFLIGSLVQSFVSTIFKDSVNLGIRILFIIQPWALFSQGMSYIGIFAASQTLNGMKWSQIDRSALFMPLSDIYLLLLLDTVIFGVLGIYIDHVLPDENGMSHSCCFWIYPGYWCPKADRIQGSIPAPSGNKRHMAASSQNPGGARLGHDHEGEEQKHDSGNGNGNGNGNGGGAAGPGRSHPGQRVGSLGDAVNDAKAVEEQLAMTKAGMDPDVIAEAHKVRETIDVDYPVRISQLGITFYARQCFCIRDPKRDFQAVREISLVLDNNSLFCLLGHNGAGKSTTINMLTGLLPPTSGDARVGGYSIRNSMHEIKKIMGICPQHDVLWSELTAAEHLQLFAAFKNVPEGQVEQEVVERLSDVDLLKYKGTLAGNFSGGMRRRLSVAIALIGNPSVVYLDEPTTGMDPISRRQVWDLIEKVKYDRVTVLTTHSMEEADVLGDRIGIMKEGKFICLGTSIRLKNKFGTGYRVTTMVDASLPGHVRKAQLKTITKFFKDNLPESSLDVIEPSSIRFKVPRAANNQLIEFFNTLEAAKDTLSIIDVQLSLTTLEEVFLSVGAIGDSHADERFGISSQIGTELTKALKRLEEIRIISEKRRRGSKDIVDPAELERIRKEEDLLDVDNSPEAIALELPQLLEIEAVALRVEKLKESFEKNEFIPFSKGTPAQQLLWSRAEQTGTHVNVAAIVADTQAKNPHLNPHAHNAARVATTSPSHASAASGSNGGATPAPALGRSPSRSSAPALSDSERIAAPNVPLSPSSRGSNNNSSDGSNGSNDGRSASPLQRTGSGRRLSTGAPTLIRGASGRLSGRFSINSPLTPRSAATANASSGANPLPPPPSLPSPVAPHGADGGEVEMHPVSATNYNDNRGHVEEDDDANTMSSEMAMQQEEVLKGYLKTKLLDTRKPCCHSFRRMWRRWSIAKRALFVIGIALLIVILVAIIGSATSRSSSTEKLAEVLQYRGTLPALAALKQGEWSEIFPGGSTICARGNEFSFFVYRPAAAALSNTNNDILFHFQGGEPCWDPASCDPRAQGIAYRVTNDINRASLKARNLTGIFSGKDSNENVFKSSLHVWIPHCSADAGWGNALTAYEGGISIEHRGALNVKAALDWTIANVPSSSHTAASNVYVVGSGVGGFGAALWLGNIRNAYTAAHVTYIGDHAFEPAGVGALFAPQQLGTGNNLNQYGTATDIVLSAHPALKRRVWGLANSPAVPTFIPAFATPATANFAIENILSQTAIHFPTQLTIIRIGSPRGSATLNQQMRVLFNSVSLATDLYTVSINPTPFMLALTLTDPLLRGEGQNASSMITEEQRFASRAIISTGLCAVMGAKDAVVTTAVPAPRSAVLRHPSKDGIATILESNMYSQAGPEIVVGGATVAVSPAQWLLRYVTASRVPDVQTNTASMPCSV